MKTALLISPTISDMYKDIISQLEAMSVKVDFIEDKGDLDDPDYIRNHKNVQNREAHRAEYLENNRMRWEQLLSRSPYDKAYDYLLVIDGMSVCPYLFEELRHRNSDIWCACYLYDSTTSLYRFQNYFRFYDTVSSFDKRDCSRYNLNFLPIYWTQAEVCAEDLEFFGLGTFSKERHDLFKCLADYADVHSKPYFIKLFQPKFSNYPLFLLKALVKKLIGDRSYITPSIYNSNLITHSMMPAPAFRDLICRSKVIIDSVNFDQDGMTARFMWAWGLGKKIITTNANILGYECYDPCQILVVKEGEIDMDRVENFLATPCTQSEEVRRGLCEWRIDNWIKHLLPDSRS